MRWWGFPYGWFLSLRPPSNSKPPIFVLDACLLKHRCNTFLFSCLTVFFPRKHDTDASPDCSYVFCTIVATKAFRMCTCPLSCGTAQCKGDNYVCERRIRNGKYALRPSMLGKSTNLPKQLFRGKNCANYKTSFRHLQKIYAQGVSGNLSRN